MDDVRVLVLTPSEHSLVAEADFGQDELRRLLAEFERCSGGGGAEMGRAGFDRLMEGRPMAHGGDMHRLFRSFDRRRTGALELSDCALGLAALQPETAHGGDAGRLRTVQMFRYYTSDHNAMAGHEFTSLLDDVVSLRGGDVSEESVSKYRECGMELFKSEPMTVLRLAQLVGGHHLRGTSALLRLRARTAFDGHDVSASGSAEAGSSTKVYTVARHALSLGADGRVRMQRIASLEGGSPVTASAQLHMENDMEHRTQVVSAGEPMLVDVTNPGGLAEHEARRATDGAKLVLSALEYFVSAHGGKAAHRWQPPPDDRPARRVADAFLRLCTGVRALLLSERRCAQLASPVYIMGDIHGNFADLMRFEQKLWPLGPRFCPAKMLFLGDYVDRGKYSFEVVAYLFAHKWLHPDKVTLLRGNHELRDVQRNFTFVNECRDKFGEHVGREVHKRANMCFDALPLAAVVDDSVLCVHGGIPHPEAVAAALRCAPPPSPADRDVKPIVRAVNSVGNDIANPAMGSLEWDLLWNDPLDSMDAAGRYSPAGGEYRPPVSLDAHGFGANPYRGDNARVFAKSALRRFLADNRLSHVVRAHQVQAHGFKLEHDAAVLTVFSSSNYCSMENGAAAVLADADRTLRLMRLQRRAVGQSDDGGVQEENCPPPGGSGGRRL